MNDSVLLESWDRQCQIISSLADRINESNRNVKPSPDGMPLAEQLAHIHAVRHGWLGEVSSDHASTLGSTFLKINGAWAPIDDLGEIKHQLNLSAKVVRDAVKQALEDSQGKTGPYDHPIFFLQHMIWHEGWHAGLIMLGLRLAGEEPPEEWEERNIWGVWRDPEV